MYESVFFSREGRSHLEANDPSLLTGSKRDLQPRLILGRQHLGDPPNDDLIVQNRVATKMKCHGEVISLDSKSVIRTFSEAAPVRNPHMRVHNVLESPFHAFFINKNIIHQYNEVGSEWFPNDSTTEHTQTFRAHLEHTLSSLNGLYLKNVDVAEIYHKFIGNKLAFIRSSWLEDQRISTFTYRSGGCGACHASPEDISSTNQEHGGSMTAHLFVHCPTVRQVLRLLGGPMPESILHYLYNNPTCAERTPLNLTKSPTPYLVYAIWKMERHLRTQPRDMTELVNQKFHSDRITHIIRNTFEADTRKAKRPGPGAPFVAPTQPLRRDQADQGIT